MANEVQRLTPNGDPTQLEDGALELTFDGQTTASISHGDINTTATFASKIQTELEALSNIGSGNVAVTWMGSYAKVEFQGTLANTNVAEITVSSNTLKRAADTVSVSTTQSGAGGANEVKRFNGDNATTGYVEFSVGLVQLYAPFDSSNVQTAFDSMYGSGNTSVSDVGSNQFTITFQSSLANQDIADLTISSNTTDTSPSTSTDSNGSTGQPQIETVTLPDSPTEGTLNVTLDSVLSSDFNWNDSTPAAITGWTTGGSAGNWTYTRDSNASNVTASGAEGSTPLRKAFTITPSTETQGSGGGYTITIGQGSYTLSGQAVGLKAGRTIAISQGSYTLSGQAVSLKKGYTVAIASGSYSLSGQAVGLTAQRTIAIAQGSYSLTGQSVAFAKGFTISIGTGSYALTGHGVGLKAARTIAIANGSYSLTGQELGLARGFVITIQQGSYSVTGQSVGVAAQRNLAIGQGAYVLSGQAVELTKGFTITLDAGTYTLNGQAIDITAQRLLDIGHGSYALAGQDVALSRGYVLAIGQGGYVLTGQDVALLADRSIGIDAGSYVLTGQGVVFVRTFGAGVPRTVYTAHLTTSAPHLAAITTSIAHAAAIPGGIETATITSSKPHKARVPRSNPQ